MEEAEVAHNEKADASLEAVTPDKDERSSEVLEVKPRKEESKTPKANLRKFFKLVSRALCTMLRRSLAALLPAAAQAVLSAGGGGRAALAVMKLLIAAYATLATPSHKKGELLLPRCYEIGEIKAQSLIVFPRRELEGRRKAVR